MSELGNFHYLPKSERRSKKFNNLMESLALEYINKHPAEAARDIAKIVKEMDEDEE